MANKSMLAILIVLVVGIIFASGCVKQQAECGNGRVEAGEDCDDSACPSGYVCKICQCVAPQEAPRPPALPA